jgi:hypothetical protein
MCSIGIDMARVELGVVRKVLIEFRPAVGKRVDREAAARVEGDEQGVDASPVVRDSPKNVRPEQGIERGLVDQADRRVEIIYPIGVNTSWSRINLHFSLVLSRQEIPMTASIFL